MNVNRPSGKCDKNDETAQSAASVVIVVRGRRATIIVLILFRVSNVKQHNIQRGLTTPAQQFLPFLSVLEGPV